VCREKIFKNQVSKTQLILWLPCNSKCCVNRLPSCIFDVSSLLFDSLPMSHCSFSNWQCNQSQIWQVGKMRGSFPVADQSECTNCTSQLIVNFTHHTTHTACISPRAQLANMQQLASGYTSSANTFSTSSNGPSSQRCACHCKCLRDWGYV